MALVLYCIGLMLAAVAIGLSSLFLSYLRPRFVPATVVLAIALTTIGAGVFVFIGTGWTIGIGDFVLTGAGWYNWFLPMALSVVLLSAFSLANWHRASTRLRNLRRGLCPDCGYDLRHGEHDACPSPARS